MSKDNENLLIAFGLIGLYWWYTHPATATSVVIPSQNAPIVNNNVPNTVPSNLIPNGDTPADNNVDNSDAGSPIYDPRQLCDDDPSQCTQEGNPLI